MRAILGEPADDGKLQERASHAGRHEEHDAGEGKMGEFRRLDEGVNGLHVGFGDEGPDDKRQRGDGKESTGGVEGVEALAKAEDLLGDTRAERLGDASEEVQTHAGERLTGQADREGQRAPGKQFRRGRRCPL